MSALRLFFRRLTARARSRYHERELDEQVASHLSEAADDYVARGLSPEDARLAALGDFGGVARTREVHRDVRSFTWPESLY